MRRSLAKLWQDGIHAGKCVMPAPDWEKRRVFLVDPAIWSRYKRGSTALRPIYQEVMAVLHGWGAEVDLLGHVSDPLDIWIRDWGLRRRRLLSLRATDEVFRDNAHLSRLEIERAIVRLGFEKIVFIPTEPGDEIGHADGMCHFVNKHTLTL